MALTGGATHDETFDLTVTDWVERRNHPKAGMSIILSNGPACSMAKKKVQNFSEL